MEIVIGIVVFAALLFAIALLFVVPSRDVTQPPGKWLIIWEVLFPGTSPAWGPLMGFVLLAWGFLAIQDVFLFWLGSPYIIASIAIPNLQFSYGVPAEWADILRLINPSWVWLYLAPAVLFAVNLVVVFRDKLFRKSP